MYSKTRQKHRAAGVGYSNDLRQPRSRKLGRSYPEQHVESRCGRNRTAGHTGRHSVVSTTSALYLAGN